MDTFGVGKTKQSNLYGGATTNISSESHNYTVAQYALVMVYGADGQVKKVVKLLGAVAEIKTRILQSEYPSPLVLVKALAHRRAKLSYCMSGENSTVSQLVVVALLFIVEIGRARMTTVVPPYLALLRTKISTAVVTCRIVLP